MFQTYAPATLGSIQGGWEWGKWCGTKMTRPDKGTSLLCSAVRSKARKKEATSEGAGEEGLEPMNTRMLTELLSIRTAVSGFREVLVG